jgi:hypothetical protein
MALQKVEKDDDYIIKPSAEPATEASDEWPLLLKNFNNCELYSIACLPLTWLLWAKF